MNTANKNRPIVLKFHLKEHKYRFCSLYWKHKNLNLSHIGFENDSRIFLNESFTFKNRQFFHVCNQLRKLSKIKSSHIKNGCIYIIRIGTDNMVLVKCLDQLNNIFPLDQLKSA